LLRLCNWCDPAHAAQQAGCFQAPHLSHFSARIAASDIGDMDNPEECERFIVDLMDEDGGIWGFVRLPDTRP